MTHSPTPIIVSGALGRMGQAILRLAAADPAVVIAGGLEAPAQVTATGGTLFGPGGVKVPVAATLDALAPRPGSVLIEFTAPAATRENVARAAQLGVAAVVGTTGLAPDDHEALAMAAQKVPVLVAANMSLGVNLLLDVVSRLAASLPDYDIEMVETHHRRKKDAPSGTALARARAAAAGRGGELETVANYGREGITGERPPGGIGIHAVRGGDVVGDHQLIFAGEGERIEVIHRASSRDTFAAGAIRAARHLAGRPAGLYSMRDVLGLNG